MHKYYITYAKKCIPSLVILIYLILLQKTCLLLTAPWNQNSGWGCPRQRGWWGFVNSKNNISGDPKPSLVAVVSLGIDRQMGCGILPITTIT